MYFHMMVRKNHMIYLKPTMLMQQHLFWKNEKWIMHDMSTEFTAIFLYEIFIYCDHRSILESINPFFKKNTGFYVTTNSKSPDMQKCWTMSKTFPSLTHLNTEKKHVIVCTVNPYELISSAVSECTKQIFNFFKI